MNDSSFSKKDSRELSAFMAREMLFDYLEDQLDPQRRTALEKTIDENRDLNTDLLKIKGGGEYCRQLGQSKLGATLSQQLQNPPKRLDQALEGIHFREWPPSLRWISEGVVVATGVAILIAFVPWQKIAAWRWPLSGSVILSEMSASDQNREMADGEVETQIAAEFADDPAVAAKAAAAVENQAESKVTTTPEKVAVVTTTTVTTIPIRATTTTVPAAASVASATSDLTPSEGGVLYRGRARITNVDAINDKLVERLEALGGRKAGQVGLGWRKGEGSYFHFTIPESKLGEMRALFSEYGRLDFSKEKHDRVMPRGILRVIIDVDEAGKPGGT